MKKLLLASSLVLLLTLSVGVAYAATGTIDPANTGDFKAQIQNSGLGANTTINFGKFTTQSANNITVTDDELTGYAWGNGVGWIVMNCSDTTSGCSGTNGNFKVANDGNGLLSGYAWGENTGWINFGPFTNPAISTVKINSNGEFGGTLGNAGYAWSQSYGWILFDCTVVDACVVTDWEEDSNTSGSTGGGTTTTNPPVIPPVQPPVVPPTPPTNTPTPPITPPVQPPVTPSIPSTPSQNPGNTGSILFCTLYPSKCPPVVPTIKKISEPIIDFFGTKTWDVTSKIVSGAGVAAAALAPLIAALFLNPFSLYDIFLLLGRLWSLILVAFGLKKRTRPWGVVYDSVTKQPLDPAYVVLTDMNGNEIATSITDIDGRYGFLVSPGTYRIMANKSNYSFPSTKLAGKNSDELYGDLYFGDTIVVTEEGGIIAKNIPLDQLNFDWNEYAKKERALTTFYHHRDVIIGRLADGLFVGGFIFSIVAVIASTTTYNIAIVALYVVMVVLKRLGIRAKPRGEVSQGYAREPVPFSIVRVLSTATGAEVSHRVTNKIGKYYCLVSNGQYKIVVDRKNPDGTYTKVPMETPVTVDKGYIKEDFRI